jgi:hypothetical protein
MKRKPDPSTNNIHKIASTEQTTIVNRQTQLLIQSRRSACSVWLIWLTARKLFTIINHRPSCVGRKRCVTMSSSDGRRVLVTQNVESVSLPMLGRNKIALRNSYIVSWPPFRLPGCLGTVVQLLPVVDSAS